VIKNYGFVFCFVYYNFRNFRSTLALRGSLFPAYDFVSDFGTFHEEEGAHFGLDVGQK
jgi:hypothetical protein